MFFALNKKKEGRRKVAKLCGVFKDFYMNVFFIFLILEI